MSTLLFYGLAALAVVAALFGMYQTIDHRGYERGVAETMQKWNDAQAKLNAATAKREQELDGQYRAKEAAWTQLVNQMQADHQKELVDEQKQRDADVAAVNSGLIKLRDKYAACSTAARRSETGGTVASSGVGNGEAGAELSREATQFLLDEANRADKIVKQLTACQAVVVADRNACH